MRPSFSASGQQALEAGGAVFEALFVGHAVAVAGETDDLFGAGSGGGLEVGFVGGDERVVVFEAVEGFFDAADFDAGGGVAGRGS